MDDIQLELPAKLGWAMSLAVGNMASLNRQSYWPESQHLHYSITSNRKFGGKSCLVNLAGALISHRTRNPERSVSYFQFDPVTRSKLHALDKLQNLEVGSAVNFFYLDGFTGLRLDKSNRVQDEIDKQFLHQYKIVWNGWQEYERRRAAYQYLAECLIQSKL